MFRIILCGATWKLCMAKYFLYVAHHGHDAFCSIFTIRNQLEPHKGSAGFRGSLKYHHRSKLSLFGRTPPQKENPSKITVLDSLEDACPPS